MTQIQLNLKSFPYGKQLATIFERYSDDYEYTSAGVFRRVTPPLCPECGNPMDHNGSNTHTKRWLGEVEIGRYLCPKCKTNIEENCDFWEEAKDEFFGILTNFSQFLRVNQVSLEVIEKALSWIYPRDKDTICTMVKCATGDAEVPGVVADIQFIHYDEQHPKTGRNQKYRLTLLDSRSRQVIADELTDSKNSETIEDFLRRNLDPRKPIFIVTDLYRGYEETFNRIFGNKAIHQFCLFHLNKLIINDFPRKTTIEQELVKYKMLNIFYNRNSEIEFLRCLIEEEQEMKKKGTRAYEEWLDEAMKLFRKSVHDHELKRRREHKTLEIRCYWDAKNNFNGLMDEIDCFDIAVRKRLKQIESHWHNLTAFYFVDGAPSTNNPLENYYSSSLKTHRKKQLGVPGIEDQINLSRLKRLGIYGRPRKTLLEAFFMFIPFIDWN